MPNFDRYDEVNTLDDWSDRCECKNIQHDNLHP